MELIYEVGVSKQGEPLVQLTHKGQHVGTIWGVVYQDTDSIFDQEHGIISIKQGNDIQAILWNTKPI